jgi:hypothetical protein
MSTEFFSYPNSDHNDQPPAESTPPAPEGLFEYPEAERQRNLPQGAPWHEVPAEIRALRANDPDRAMFRPMYDAVRDHPEDDATMKAFRAEAREQLADMSISNVEAREVVGVFEEALRDGIPSQETVDQWEREAVQETFRRYGRDAESRLADARALVQRDPRVRQLLNATGLASHPTVVRLLLEKSHSEKMRGRLKIK